MIIIRSSVQGGGREDTIGGETGEPEVDRRRKAS